MLVKAAAKRTKILLLIDGTNLWQVAILKHRISLNEKGEIVGGFGAISF